MRIKIIIGYKILTVLLCLFVIVSVVSCNNKNNNKVESDLLSMQEKSISLPLNKMLRLHSQKDTLYHEREKQEKTDYQYIVFIDSTHCSTCAIDGMYRWNSIIDSIRNNKDDLKFVFIVSPKRSQLEDVFLAVESSGLKNDIYVDSLYEFVKSNQHLPQDTKYHSFLMDKNNKVVLVGNILSNLKIRKMFNKLLYSK